MLAKMMLPAGAGAAAATIANGAAGALKATRGVVVPQTGGKAKMRAILELAFGGIHIAGRAANALGGIVLDIWPSRWTVMVATATFSTSFRSTSFQRVLKRMPKLGSTNFICSSYKHS